MQVSIAFDPTTDAQDDIIAAVAALYGSAPAAIDTPTATSDAATGEVKLDSTGVPHDLRIHSNPATMTDKGVWRKKRGIDDITFNTVSAELKGKHGGAPAAPVAPVVTAPTPAPAPVVAAPAAPSLPMMAPVAAAPTVPTNGYPQFVDFLAQHIVSPSNPSGRLTNEWVSQALTSYGVASGKLTDLETATPELISQLRTGIAGALGVAA